MKRLGSILALCLMGGMLMPGAAFAGPDNYIGDTAIYGGSTIHIQPNVLVILDTSGSMNDATLPSDPYDPTTTYPVSGACSGGGCTSDTVYKCTAFGLECGNWTKAVDNVDSVTTSCGFSNPQNFLKTLGQWNSWWNKLSTSGACRYHGGGGIYALGNWINWNQQPSNSPQPKIDIAKEVLTNLVKDTSGVNFGLMVFDQNGSAGGQFLVQTVDGAQYTTTIKNMEETFSGTTTNRDALLQIVKNVYASGWTPLAETLFEAMRYFEGGESAFSHTEGVDATGHYTSPITASCQQNYVVLITDGMSTQDQAQVLKTICDNGDCDSDGFEPDNDPAKSYPNNGSDYLDDVAWYIHHTDLASQYVGKQTATVFTVGFGLGGADAGAVKLLKETAENGGGEAYLSNDEQQLSAALQQIMGRIFQVDTSFVAPVVPISPENRTYSGDRVYLGFFRPEQNGDWLGNIKKFGLDVNGNVIDKNGDPATNADGSFKPSAVSYWGTYPDGGSVDTGGVGQLLATRTDPSPDLTPSSTNPRQIYTNLTGTDGDLDLTLDTNRFKSANLTPGDLGLDPTDTTGKADLINYIYGIDVYDDNLNNSKTDNRDWDLGDILHSRPAIVSYNTFGSSAEGTCPGDWTTAAGSTVNKSVIYVGSDDGMLHAFSDCNGQELWGFIPKDFLGNLSSLHGSSHTYFQDSSPVTYVYDKNNDGIIDPAEDKVVLLFGQRRGGGTDTLSSSGSRGAYYALDVTVPTKPKLLWRIDNTTAGFSKLGETWSKPTLARMKLADGAGGTKQEIVAFFGAGYDNNEDLRFGNTQTFPASTDSTVTSADTNDSGTATSSGTSAQHNPKGRGVYAVKVADLDANGVPTLAGSPVKVWGYTYVDPATDATRNADNNPSFSIPSEVAALDSDFDGFVDRLYVGDTGGNLWRFSVGDPSTANWSATRIFDANDPNKPLDVGRKIFYKPSVVLEHGYAIVYFGTGDRAHPLNQSVVDRMYAVKDRNQDAAKYESSLVDLTDDYLQATSLTSAQLADIEGQGYTSLSDYQQQMNQTLNSSGNYGWYIKLSTNSGEKVLSPPLAYNKVAYFTTYAPNFISTDPCRPGNLGLSRLYALDYLNGGAVKNYDTSNDTTVNGQTTQVLNDSDRGKEMGVGIPSGIVLVFPKTGDARILVGSGGGLPGANTTPGGRFYPLYWLQQ